MLIVIDLSSLYFSIRDLNITLNYEKLITYFKDQFGEETELHAFTVADSQNTSQTRFLEKLKGLGVELHIYGFDTPSKFSTEIMTWGALSDKEEVVLVSGDGDLIRSFELMKGAGRSMSLCFFSEKLAPSWNPRVIAGDVKFIDLSNPEIRKVITGPDQR
jgi:uncharacterized LabA/DUF88 family protein